MIERFDAAVVGGGIVGLAHAFSAAQAGLRVVVFEKTPEAQAASVRNFGLIWPIGQLAGERYRLAMQSRSLWMTVLGEARIPFVATGSLHVAYRNEEAEVVREFASIGPEQGYACEWLEPEAAVRLSPGLKREGLRGALYSDSEVMVDPRSVLQRLPQYLAASLGVHVRFGQRVTNIQDGLVWTGRDKVEAPLVFVCPGGDLEELYAEELAQHGMIRTKLQMLRTVPQPDEWKMGPALAGGLTLRFYPAFRICRSLPALQERVARDMPEYERWGIHTMVSQAGDGSLTLGDSHEDGARVSPFLKQEIDSLIVRHVQTFFAPPDLSIAERWYGVYVKHPQDPFCHIEPEPGVHVVTGLGGAGMTLAFGVARTVVEQASPSNIRVSR